MEASATGVQHQLGHCQKTGYGGTSMGTVGCGLGPRGTGLDGPRGTGLDGPLWVLLRVLPTQPHYFQDFKSSFWGKTCNEIKGLQGCPFRREYVQKEGL
jgi:hypothetical protein